MGNNKFRFSDMIPNAWFYKLKDMSKSRKRNGSHHVLKNNTNSKVTSPTTSQRSHPRCSNYFPNEAFIRAGKLYNTPIHNNREFFGGSIPCPLIDSSPRMSSSSKRRSRRKTIYKPSPTVVSSSSSTFMAHSNFDSAHNNLQSPDYDASSIESSSESDDDFHEYVYSESECDSFSVPDLLNGIDSNCSCRVSSSTNDIIIDMNNEHFKGNMSKKDGLETISQLGLAPILTKSERFDDKVIESEAADSMRSSTELDDELQGDDESLNVKSSIEESNGRERRRRKSGHVSRRPPTNSPSGIRLRVNSPKLASRKIQAYARKSVSSNGSKSSRNAGFPDGYAVVKSSFDPQSDFRDSMLEMIVENNIRASKDLEDLLACYLSLNSSEFHDLIVKAFEQIWFDLAQLRM